ncbi:relaxase domain-containing protein [Spirillospora sp. NPDC050679]
MLTVRTLRFPSTSTGHWSCPVAATALAEDLAPRAFARTDHARRRAHAMWLGTPWPLMHAGVKRGAAVGVEELAMLLRGFDPIHGLAGIKQRGDRAVSGHLTFSAPNSVSWLWTQSDDEGRAEIEQAMIQAAHRMLGHLALNRPLLDGEQAGTGYVAAIALHAIARDSPQPPPPLLHVHCYLLGIAGEDGDTWAPDPGALAEETLGREGGAFGRAVLADELRDLGFQIQARTGHQGRYFEVKGVPTELLRPQVSVQARCDGPVQEEPYGA